MRQQGAYLYSAAAHLWRAEETGPPDLKPLLHTAWGRRFRRVNHFIELALIGVKSCVDRSPIPVRSDCDLYLATEHGNVADVAKITAALFQRRELPMPLEFINVPNNMAGFYVAQELALHSANLTIAHRAFAFETALDLALFNLTTSRNPDPCALVGSVEACAYPLAQHRQRLRLAAGTPLTEGSSWLYMGGDATGARARCHWVTFFPDEASLLSFLKREAFTSATYLAGSGHLEGAQLDKLSADLGLHHRYGDHSLDTSHETHCAATLTSFITDHPGASLLHINRERQGRYAVVYLSTINGCGAIS